MEPILTAEDRSLAVPPGETIVTGYVAIHKIRLFCRDRMAIGDVKGAYERRLQLGERQPWPCPRGIWEDDSFVIIDGRHEFVAALMIGHDFLFVAWPGNEVLTK